jgi:Holliday junction resolvasome RuvABC endonuclease subunit
MIILGIDAATKTGWAVYDTDEGGRLIESGVQDFSKKRGESNGLMFLRFRKWLDWMMRNIAPSVVCYEQSHHRGGAATEIGYGLTTRIQEAAIKYGVEYAPVRTTTLKKHATGKGNADKELMVARARAILGREPVDDNEADAVHICRWGAGEFAVVSVAKREG